MTVQTSKPRSLRQRSIALAALMSIALTLGSVPVHAAQANESSAGKSNKVSTSAKANKKAKANKVSRKSATTSSSRKAKNTKASKRAKATKVSKRNKSAKRAKATKVSKSSKARARKTVRKSSRSRVYKPRQYTPRVQPAHVYTPQGAGKLSLMSNAAFVVDQDSGETLVAKNSDVEMPIASLTKLMTALVVVEAKLPMDEVLEISSEDVDREKNTHSRLAVGTQLTRSDMLLLALMSSENRASMALSRGYPGGRSAFLAKMNAKAKALGMMSTHFADPAGLSSQSVSTARDLHRLVIAADAHPLIRQYSTQEEDTIKAGRRTLKYINSNRLVRSGGDWDIGLQKTGFTNEAGRCLVMQVTLHGRRVAMVFLDSFGQLTRYADAKRVRQQLELNGFSQASHRTSMPGSAIAP